MKKITLNTPSKKIAFTGIRASLALILGYLEFLISFDAVIPGIKLGLANLAVLCALVCIGKKAALSVCILKVCLTSLLFGNFFSFCYSLLGGLLSLAVMALLKTSKKFGVIGISAAGGVAHNIGQIIAAVILLSETKIALYTPILIASGAITGTMIGICLNTILKKIIKNYGN